jgi:hypothetical protein
MLGSLFFIGEADESRKNRVDHLEMKLGIITQKHPESPAV